MFIVVWEGADEVEQFYYKKVLLDRKPVITENQRWDLENPPTPLYHHANPATVRNFRTGAWLWLAIRPSNTDFRDALAPINYPPVNQLLVRSLRAREPFE